MQKSENLKNFQTELPDMAILNNGVHQNKQKQKSDSTSKDQLFMTRNFAFGPKKIPSL